MPSEYSGDGQHRPPIDNLAIVRKRVVRIIEHNTGGPQPSAAQVTSIVSIAARADLDPATVRSVLDKFAAEGVIERSTTNSDARVALM